MLRFLSRTTLTVTLTLLVACGGSGPGGGGQVTAVYGGVFMGDDGTEGGNISLTLRPEDGTGSGTFVVNGAVKSFSAISFDSLNHDVVSATGAGFAFTGSAADTLITGSYTSPAGSGLFVVALRSAGGSLTSYCGTHIGTRTGVPIAGGFAFVQSGASRYGVFSSVLSQPFRGYLRSLGGNAVALDTLNGTGSVTVAGGGGFTGSYATVAGDTGSVEGAVCRSSVTSPILSIYQGVLGSFDGGETGSFAFSLSSTGLGSSGSYKIGSVVTPFLAVISGVGNKFAAFDSAFQFIGALDTTTMSGRYAKTGSVAGRVAGVNQLLGDSLTLYCGNHDNNGINGAFAFVERDSTTIYGLFTGGTDSTFQGDVTGETGSDGAVMQGQAGPVTVLASGGAFSGFFPGGSLIGNVCP
ncbi:MAG: hypothetical protein ABI587_06670 [Gemmatimonadales bacterium]